MAGIGFGRCPLSRRGNGYVATTGGTALAMPMIKTLGGYDILLPIGDRSAGIVEAGATFAKVSS